MCEERVVVVRVSKSETLSVWSVTVEIIIMLASAAAAASPHVYHAVSELAAVSSTHSWVNTKVRVVAKLLRPDLIRKTAVLESIGEPDGTFHMAVSVISYFFV